MGDGSSYPFPKMVCFFSFRNLHLYLTNYFTGTPTIVGVFMHGEDTATCLRMKTDNVSCSQGYILLLSSAHTQPLHQNSITSTQSTPSNIVSSNFYEYSRFTHSPFFQSTVDSRWIANRNCCRQIVKAVLHPSAYPYNFLSRSDARAICISMFLFLILLVSHCGYLQIVFLFSNGTESAYIGSNLLNHHVRLVNVSSHFNCFHSINSTWVIERSRSTIIIVLRYISFLYHVLQ
jgi:hypothetical protein